MIEIFYPEQFGDPDLGDGVKDSTQAIKDACSKIQSNGRGVLCLPGRYRISGPISLPEMDHFHVEGSGASQIIVDSSFPGGVVLQTFPKDGSGSSGIKGSSKVSAATSRGDTFVPVLDPSKFSVGDVIHLTQTYSSAIGSTIHAHQYNEVSKVGKAGLGLVLPTSFSIPSGTNVELLRLRRGLILQDFSVVSDGGGADHTSLLASYEREAHMENLSFSGQGLNTVSAFGGGLILSRGYRNRIHQVDCDSSGSGGENGIGIKHQTMGQFSDLRVSRSMFGVGLSWCSDCQVSNVHVTNDAARAFKLFGSLFCQVTSILVNRAAHVGVGLAGGTKHCTLQGVTIRAVSDPGGQNIGIWANGESNNNNFLLDVITDDCSFASATFTDNDSGNLVQFLLNLTSPPIMGANSRAVYL
jgi:hypothetical protein